MNAYSLKPRASNAVIRIFIAFDTSFQQDDLREDVNQNVQEYRIRVVVSLALTDAATGKVLWKEPSFAGETTYFLTGTQASTQSAATDAALTDLATRVVERTVESW